MRLSFAASCTFLACLFFAAVTMGQQTESDEFELRGTVLNSTTGEPLSGALVQLSADGSAQFTDADGNFVFTKLPRGRYSAMLRKPGYFSEQEISPWNAGKNSLLEVPSGSKVVLKLIPEVIIYGEVKNEIGEPVEGVTVRAQRWQAEVGQKQLRNFGEGVTDDEGKFRIAELKPGKYQLAFLPGNRGGWSVISKLRRREQAAQGYGVQFYPGVQDPALAMGIELRAGAKFHVSQTLSRERLYEIAGVVRGASSASGSSVSLMDAEGNIMQRIVRMDPKTGEFQIPGIPAGTYLLSAMGFDETQNGGNTPATTRLRATLPVHVKSDLAGVVLTLGQGISVGVRVDDEAPTDEEGNVHQVFVRLISKEFPQYSPGTQVPPHGDERLEPKIDDILPGTYTVEAMLNHSGYIASLRSGHTDLLRDELTVAPGTVPPPIEVTVRTDGAQLSVTTLENGEPAAAGVVLYSQEYPRRSLASQSNELGKLSMAGIPPGQYEVIAVRNAQDLEFLNPASMEKYMEHAVAVTLHSNDEASVRVEVQEPEEQEQ